MTISRTGHAWTSDPSLLSKKQVGYYRARLRNRIYQLVLLGLEASGLTRAEIARRIYKRPEQITRLLGAPGNWTLDTVSDLLLAIGCELGFSMNNLADRQTKAAPEQVATTQPNVITPQTGQISFEGYAPAPKTSSAMDCQEPVTQKQGTALAAAQHRTPVPVVEKYYRFKEPNNRGALAKSANPNSGEFQQGIAV